MAYLRRHWRASALQVALLSVCILVLVLGLLTRRGDQALAQDAVKAQAQEVEAVDPVVYGYIQSLREELALTTADLAAMGLTGAEVESLLNDFRGWVEANQGRLEAQERSQRQAEAAVRQAMRQVHVGPRPRNDPTLRGLPQLQGDLAAAAEQGRQLHEELKQRVESRLTSGARTVWQAALNNRRLPDQYRYVPGVSESDRQAIVKATRQRRLTDRSYRGRQSADGLSSSQKAMAEAARANQLQRFDEVRAAVDKVLPAPPPEGAEGVNLLGEGLGS